MDDAALKVVVSVKSPQKATGDSFVTRYIAESQLDAKREGDSPRLLFTEQTDGLSWTESDSFLSNDGSTPAKRDIIHLVVTFTSEDYLALSDSEEGRMEAVRATTRQVMKTVEGASGVLSFRWAAGIHRNTDNPHVHIAISKDAVALEGSEVKRVERLPQELFAHVRSSEAEGNQPTGLLAATFASSLRAAMPAQV